MKRKGRKRVQVLILAAGICMSLAGAGTVQAASGNDSAERQIRGRGAIVASAEPEEPGGETPGGETPGTEEPGGENPGGEEAGGETPGTEDPSPEPGESGTGSSSGNAGNGTGSTGSGSFRNSGKKPATGDRNRMMIHLLTGLTALIFLVWSQRLKLKQRSRIQI